MSKQQEAQYRLGNFRKKIYKKKASSSLTDVKIEHDYSERHFSKGIKTCFRNHYLPHPMREHYYPTNLISLVFNNSPFLK